MNATGREGTLFHLGFVVPPTSRRPLRTTSGAMDVQILSRKARTELKPIHSVVIVRGFYVSVDVVKDLGMNFTADNYETSMKRREKERQLGSFSRRIGTSRSVD